MLIYNGLQKKIIVAHFIIKKKLLFRKCIYIGEYHRLFADLSLKYVRTVPYFSIRSYK